MTAQLKKQNRGGFVTGDVHGGHDIDKLNTDNFPVGNTLTYETNSRRMKEHQYE